MQMCSDIASAVSTKFGMSFASDYSFPKIKGNFKGSLPKSVRIPKPSDIPSSTATEKVVVSEILSSLGSVTPSAQIVVKTRRLSDSMKVFINLCSHESVPGGKFCCTQSSPKVSTDKEGGTMLVLDACVNSGDYKNNCSTEIERNKVRGCTYIYARNRVTH
jgi:hypothetical protein